MRIAIVDDLPADQEKLYNDICRWSKETLTPLVPTPALFSSGEELLQNIEKNSYDIIFLDIYMSGMNGMETARQIRGQQENCRIIFTTLTPDFAVESYDVNSSYYLLKPYPYEKLSQALDRCKTSALEQNQFITIPGRIHGEKLYLHSITYTEYIDRHVIVHMNNGNERILSMRQSDFADTLLKYPYFCDCMKGVLVNFEAVEKMEKDRFLLRDGHSIPISRLKYQSVRDKFLDYSYARTRGNKL